MAAQYYTQRKAYIEEVMTLNYGPAAAEAALRLDENTTEPFYYEFGFGTGSDIASTLPVSLFAIALVCSIICAPVFASDYSTGADDIQRCTRCGCKRLGQVEAARSHDAEHGAVYHLHRRIRGPDAGGVRGRQDLGAARA